jgi:lipoate-protein ligase A
MIKPSMLYVKHFHYLNLQKFQTVNLLKKHGKICESVKLQMLISRFEEIKMLEEETFGEFYSKMSDLRNSMVSLGKPVSDVKLIRKILKSLPERFRIKVTTIEESKDLEEMMIEKLVGSLQT